jgi:hypothetical protein
MLNSFVPCISDKEALEELIDFFNKSKGSNEGEYLKNIANLKKVTKTCSNTIDTIRGVRHKDNSTTVRERVSDVVNNISDAFSLKVKLGFKMTDKLYEGLSSLKDFELLYDKEHITGIDKLDKLDKSLDPVVAFIDNHINNLKNLIKPTPYFLLLNIYDNIPQPQELSRLQDHDRTGHKRYTLYFKNNEIYRISIRSSNEYQHQKIEIAGINRLSIKDIVGTNRNDYGKYLTKVEYKFLNDDGKKIANTELISDDLLPIKNYKTFTQLFSDTGFTTSNVDNIREILDMRKDNTKKNFFKFKFRKIQPDNIGNIIVYLQNGKYYLKNDNDIYVGKYTLENNKVYNSIVDIVAQVENYLNSKLNNTSSTKIELEYKIIDIEENAQGGGKYNLKTQFKEILGKKMRIYKIANSRKEHVKYKGDIITLAAYRKLMEKKSNSNKVYKAKKSVVANKK